MDLSVSARIGNSVMAKALGLQKNYKEIKYIETSVLDEAQTGCYECPYYEFHKFYNYLPPEQQKIMKQRCAACSHAVYRKSYKEKRIYYNEKAMYGYQPRLKSNAVKLLLLLHFLHPGTYGDILDISVKDLAAKICCDTRTIINCLTILDKYGYIVYCTGAFYGTVSVMIKNYEEYHKPANEGGRGYFTLTQDFLNKILSIKDINLLRIILRVYMMIDRAAQTENKVSIDLTYAEISNFLPDYGKRNIIQKTLAFMSELFGVSLNEQGVHFSLLLNPHTTIQDLKKESISAVTSFIKGESINLNNEDINDCAMLSIEYSLNEVTMAIKASFKELDPIANFGGYVRSWIRSFRTHHFLSPLMS